MTGRKHRGREGGKRPSKADEPSRRFWEQGQGKPSTSSRGFAFFPLLSHPERVHRWSVATPAGGPLVMPNSSQHGSDKQAGSSRRTKVIVRTVTSDLVRFKGPMVREDVVQPQLENCKKKRTAKKLRNYDHSKKKWPFFYFFKKPLEQTFAQNYLF